MCIVQLLFPCREAAQLAEAWNDEIAFGGIAFQWSEQFEAELARMEAELDGTVQVSLIISDQWSFLMPKFLKTAFLCGDLTLKS
ncbi:unnamed protein product [Trichobilharzia regenti]|nr:unnamed protein product [Trichobilharzia regenti]